MLTPDALAGYTIPRLLRERVERTPHAVAYRYKCHGIYHELTWRDYQAAVERVAKSFIALGLRTGGHLAIMGNACIEYIMADMAAVLAGAVPCGIYPTSSPREVAHLLRLTNARHFVAETQEHLDRLLDAEREQQERLVDRIVLIDGRTAFLYDDPRMVQFAALMDESNDDAALAEELRRRSDALKPTDTASVTFSSGTTGLPKAACHSHAANIVGIGLAFLDVCPELARGPQRTVCYLPLAHGIERGMTALVPLLADVVPHIGERGQSQLSLLREVRPTFLHGVPRIWEKLAGHIEVGVEGAGWLARKAFQWARKVGQRRAGEIGQEGKASRWLHEMAYRVAEALVIAPIRFKVGLLSCAGAMCAGAPLPLPVQKTWQGWGIPLRNLFGTTESWVIAAQAGAWPRPGAPLHRCSVVDIRVQDDGELMVKGLGAFSGYLGDAAATSAIKDADGYVATGDVVQREGDGFLIVDRKKDIIITSGGKNVAPAVVETALMSSPYISQAIVFGDLRKYIVALIEIDFENVSNWARQQGIPYTGFSSLAQNPAVIELIGEQVEKANAWLARVEQVKKFWIIDRELVPEDGNVTATRKVKRMHAYETFKDQVEAMYAD